MIKDYKSAYQMFKEFGGFDPEDILDKNVTATLILAQAFLDIGEAMREENKINLARLNLEKEVLSLRLKGTLK